MWTPSLRALRLRSATLRTIGRAEASPPFVLSVAERSRSMNGLDESTNQLGKLYQQDLSELNAER
jgi:hypothetical protein